MFRSLQSSVDSYVGTVLRLLGHLLSTGIVFVSYFFLIWCVYVALYFLNSIHPFPSRILEFVENFELYLIYGDSVICAMALLVAAFNFLSAMLGRPK